MVTIPKEVTSIDFFVWSCEMQPRFILNSTPIDNKKILQRLKKVKANHLLQYFTVNYDDRGVEFVTCDIPPAFEGLILNQIKESLNKKESNRCLNR